jgi:hypothetical protein
LNIREYLQKWVKFEGLVKLSQIDFTILFFIYLFLKIGFVLARLAGGELELCFWWFVVCGGAAESGQISWAPWDLVS